MLKKIRDKKHLIALLWVFVLIAGQSLASVSSCNMDSIATEDHTGHMMDGDNPHAGHDMSQMAHTTDQASDHSAMSDCCKDVCQCAQNTCNTSLTLLTNPTGLKFFNADSSWFQPQLSFNHSQASSALFRPPIIC